MKKSLTVLSFLLALVMCFSVVGCGGNDNKDGDNTEPETETVSFTQPEITMDEWDTVKLGASSSKGSAITLTVSDPSVLYLKGINLTALKAGTATVTAALKNQPSVTAVLTVNINENAAKRPVLAVTGKKSLGIGDTAEYSATINGGAANATFAVDKTDIAAIDSASGKMTAKKVGTVKITATAVYCGVTFNGEYSVGVNPQVIFKNDVSDLKVNVKDEIYDGFDEGYSVKIGEKNYPVDADGYITLSGADFVENADDAVAGKVTKGGNEHDFELNIKFAALSCKLYDYYKDGGGVKHFDLIEKDADGYKVNTAHFDPNTNLPTIVIGVEQSGAEAEETKMADAGYKYVRIHVKFNSFESRSASIVHSDLADYHYTFGYWFQDLVGTGTIGWFMWDNEYVDDGGNERAFGGSINYMVDSAPSVHSYVNIYKADGTLIIDAGNGDTGWTQSVPRLETNTEYIIEIATYMQYKVRLSGFNDAVITHAEWVKERLSESK